MKKINVEQPNQHELYSSLTGDTGNIFFGLSNVAQAIIYLANIVKAYFEDNLNEP